MVLRACSGNHIVFQVDLALVGSAAFAMVLLQNNCAELVGAFAGPLVVAKALARPAVPRTLVLVPVVVERLPCIRSSGLMPVWGSLGSCPLRFPSFQN